MSDARDLSQEPDEESNFEKRDGKRPLHEQQIAFLQRMHAELLQRANAASANELKRAYGVEVILNSFWTDNDLR